MHFYFWEAAPWCKYVPKTFLPPQDAGEFAVGLDLPPGTNLEAMNEAAKKADKIIRSNKEVEVSALTVGNQTGKSEVADFYVRLVPAKMRHLNTMQLKEKLREQLKPLAYANPQVKDYDAVAGGQRPFNVNLIGLDQQELERLGTQAFNIIRKHPGLKDVDIEFPSRKTRVPGRTRSSQIQRAGNFSSSHGAGTA